jgi:L-2-hydroxycarboxylate dehydrogenase (NAD+)
MELPEEFTLVNWQAAVDFAARAFAAVGVPDADARRAGEALVDADLHSTFSHGLKNLRNYITQVTSGRINPQPNIRDVGGAKAARVMDADNALGHVAGHYGMSKAIELARQYGVGAVFMRGSNHYGASGYWARLALRENMAGFAFSNAAANMAPWGAKKQLVGNNPPAWVAPSQMLAPGEQLLPGDTQPAFIDIALSVVAGNRLDIYKRRGEDLPPGWALDGDGNETLSAAARAAGGSFMPVAQYKGSGLAIVMSLISSFLSQAPFDDQRNEQAPGVGPTLPATCSHWFEAYDVKQFTDPQQFASKVRGVQERIRSTEPRAGLEQVYAPGDIENERAARWKTEGIPLEDFVIAELGWVAEHVGIQFDLV